MCAVTDKLCVFNLLQILGPSAPENLTTCNVTTTQICISWNKPNGGNEIDNYTLIWTKQNDSKLLSFNAIHNVSTVAYTYTINGLVPGQKVNFSVSVNNVANRSQPAENSAASSKHDTSKSKH